MISLPSASDPFKRLAQLAPAVGIHHLRISNHAAKPRLEIRPAVPVLRGEPPALRAMENCAETFRQLTREVWPTVDDDACHGLPRVRAQHARLLFVHDEVLGGHNMPD